MEKIFSKIDNKLLHIINRLDSISERTDLTPVEQFLQVSSLKLPNGKTFKPHKHVWKQGEQSVITQESWIVITGKVRVILYDLDDTIIYTTILKSGDCSITFFGGHTYEILEKDTIVYEYKTGPYKGQELDKEFI